MPFVTYEVQLRNDGDRSLSDLRELVEAQATEISGWGGVYHVKVTEEPQFEARDGEVVE